MNRKKPLKRIVSILLCAVMVLGTAPLGIFASAEDDEWTYIPGISYEPVTVYERQTSMADGNIYLIDIDNHQYFISYNPADDYYKFITAPVVTKGTELFSNYVTTNDGSDTPLSANFIVDETGTMYRDVELKYTDRKFINPTSSIRMVHAGSTGAYYVSFGTTGYNWTYNNNMICYRASDGTYYLNYQDNGANKYALIQDVTTNATVYPYLKKTVYKMGEGPGDYYQYIGTTDYFIDKGDSFDERSIESGISILRKSADDGTITSLDGKSHGVSLKWAADVDTDVPGTYNAAIYINGKVFQTITVHVGDESSTISDKLADPSTSDLRSKFPGLASDDGKVLADKTVQAGKDEFGAFDFYGNDEFSVSLSALGQSYYVVKTEETKELERMHPDVIFVIDASASMLEEKVAGSSTVTRAEATATALNNAIKTLYAEDPETRVGIVTFNDNWNETGVYLPLDKYTLPEGQTNYVLWNGRNIVKSSSSGKVSGTYSVRTTSSSKTATAVTLSASPVSSTDGINRPADSELTFLAKSNGVSYYVGYYNKSIYVFRSGIDKRISVFGSSGNINTFYVDENIKITRTGTGTDKGVSYQTYSYSDKAGTYNISKETIENVISTNFLINSSGKVVKPSSYQFHYSCGTYTQAGLKAAENMFYERAGTNLKDRVPTIVLITDGIPTIGDPNTMNPILKVTMGVTEGYGYSEADSVTSQHLANLGLYTIKTGMYVKQRIDSYYRKYWDEDSNTSASFYSIGPGVDYIFGKTVLDPCQENLEEAKKETVGVGGESGNAVAVDLYNTIVTNIGSNNIDYVDYVDWSWSGNMSADDINEAFRNIAKSLAGTTRPIAKTKTEYESASAMCFNDNIGEGMTITDEPIIVYNNKTYSPTEQSAKLNADNSTTVTYTYDYKVREASTNKEYSLSKLSVNVKTMEDGTQSVSWNVPAELVPIIMHDTDNDTYTYADPIRVVYKVGLVDSGVDGTYYTNSTDDLASAEFTPTVGNPYYYTNTEGEDGKMHSTLKGSATSSVAKTSNPTETVSNSSETAVSSDGTVHITLGNNGVETVASVDITVTKVWDDINNSYGARPDGITVQLFRSGAGYKSPITINSSDVEISKDSDGKDIWTYTINDLPYSEEYVYTVKEIGVDNHYKASYSDDGLTIINKLIQTDVDIDKWADGDTLEDTGVAEVHLTASGVPTNYPVDVLFVTDLSNSMYWEIGTSTNAVNGENAKIDTLKSSVANFADDFLSNNSGDSINNNTISFVGFGGIDKDYLDNYDTVAKINRYTDVTQTLFTSEDDIAVAKQKVNDITYNYDDGNVYLTYDGTVAPVDSNKIGLAYGGTNYDHGFMEAANAIEQIKENYYNKTGENYDLSDRQIYVLFITDGAPTHWNGKTYTSTPKDTTRPDANAMWKNQNGEKVRYEYMETDQAGWYDYISSTPNYWATQILNTSNVTGMSAVGIDMAHGGFNQYVFTEESGYPLDVVIQNIISDYTVETLFADTSADLADDILSLSSKINGCGSDAYVIDTMGSQYDLQMAAAVDCGIAENGTISLADYGITPSITVSIYDTYKSSAVGAAVNGVTVTNDMVGERTGADAITLETVTFNADGTQAFSDRLSGNIMSDGVIYAEHFTYNSTSSSVTLSDGTVLPAESFKWKIGHIPQNEIELSYYVYLNDSMEGGRPQGTYDTNDRAVLSYVDSFGNNQELTYPVPSLTWDKAKISYELYLVDQNGSPITENGEATDFENRTVVSELKELEVYLNTSTVIDYDKLAEILPEGYIIFSPEATYTGNIGSNDSLNKSVISDTTETTKVFDPSTAQTGNDGTVTGITDYRDVKVAFAVVKITINPDVIVVDYGKPIVCSPLDNDCGAISVVGLGAMDSDKYSDEYTSQNGVFRIKGNEVTFSPFSYMSSINRVRYYAKVQSSDETKVLSSTIFVIPATTVYYEDNFGGSAENGGLYIEYTGDWYTVTDDGTKTGDLSAKADAEETQDRGETGQGHTPYGYDSSYDGDYKFSDGTAAVVEGSITREGNKTVFNATAAFTYTGTGFDIISRTDLDCGMITVVVKEHETGELVASVPVINKGVDTLYQIPVISYTGEEYGTYDVTINVSAPLAYLGITGSTFYLDAIRIYDPMGKSSSDNAEFDEADEAYNTDKEANAFVASIRDFIIQVDNLGVDEAYGAVYVDTINNGYNEGGVIGNIKKPEYTDEQKRWRTMSEDELNTFELVGPNEEVYLTPGYGIGFIAETNILPESVQLEIKMPTPAKTQSESVLSVQTYGKASSQKNFSVKSATEMFYDITDAVQFTKENGVYRATVILSNGLPTGANPNEIVSVTNIKMTYPEGTEISNNFGLDAADEETISFEQGTLEYAENAEMEALANCGAANVSLKASSETYKQVFDTVYVQRIASTPNYDVVNSEITDTVVSGEYADITFNTASFVDDVILADENGNEIALTDVNCTTDEAKRFTDDYLNTKTWTAKARLIADEGTHEYTIKSANENGEAETLTVDVRPAELKKLSVKTAPEKTVYTYGEAIDTTGLELEAKYTDDTEKTITDGMTLSNTTADRSGKMTVTATVDGKETEFTVNVVSLVSAKDGTVVDYENKVIYGIEVNSPEILSYVESLDSKARVVCGDDIVGTGSEITLVYGEETVDKYEAVIFGDVNGDGWYDATDAIIVNCLASGLLSRVQVGEAVYMAADCNRDGNVDYSDVEILEQAGMLASAIDQTQSTEELMETCSAFGEYLSLIEQKTETTETEKTVKEAQTEDTSSQPEQKEQSVFDLIMTVIQKLISFISSAFAIIKNII